VNEENCDLHSLSEVAAWVVGGVLGKRHGFDKKEMGNIPSLRNVRREALLSLSFDVTAFFQP